MKPSRRLVACILAVSSAAVLSFILWSSGRSEAGRPSPLSGNSLYQLDSHWTAHDGRALRLAELRGKARVISMIFTRCPSACPTLVREIQTLERQLSKLARERTGFVLVSIDPDHDTPDVLRAYAHKMGVAKPDWTLLRGTADHVRELAATLGVSYGKGEGAELAHSKLITVLNVEGEIVHQQMGVVGDPERLVAAVETAAQTGPETAKLDTLLPWID